MSAELDHSAVGVQDRAPLIGRYDHRLDPKRRLTVPLRWVERLGRPSDVYVMRSLTGERCLEVFAAADFDQRMAPFRLRSLSDARLAAFLREISESTESLAVDSQNRIRIPDTMLAYAGLVTEVVLYGSGFHFEVWSLDRRPRPTGEDDSERLAALAAESREFKF